MFFGVINSLTTFQLLMNIIFANLMSQRRGLTWQRETGGGGAKTMLAVVAAVCGIWSNGRDLLKKNTTCEKKN